MDRSSDLSSPNINDASNESASSSMILQSNVPRAGTSHQLPSSPMNVQRNFQKTSNELSNISRIAERNLPRTIQRSKEVSSSQLSVQRTFPRAEISTISSCRESGDQAAGTNSDQNFYRSKETENDNSMIVNQFSGNRTGISNASDGDIKVSTFRFAFFTVTWSLQCGLAHVDMTRFLYIVMRIFGPFERL